MCKKQKKEIEGKIFFIFYPLGDQEKNRIFKKFSKSADFLYMGYREHESERFFQFWLHGVPLRGDKKPRDQKIEFSQMITNRLIFCAHGFRVWGTLIRMIFDSGKNHAARSDPRKFRDRRRHSAPGTLKGGKHLYTEIGFFVKM